MLGFVPQPNLPKLLLNSAYQRMAETQRERCLSLGYRSEKLRRTPKLEPLVRFVDQTFMVSLEMIIHPGIINRDASHLGQSGNKFNFIFKEFIWF